MIYKPFSAKIRLSRLIYYLKSFCGVWWHIPLSKRGLFLFDVIFFSTIKTIYLQRQAFVFRMRTLLDVLTLKEVVLDQEYEKIGVSFTKNDTVIVDIGAGFGDFSIMMAKKFPHAVIYAFEPDIQYFNLLKENILLNQVANVYPIHKAIHAISDVFVSVPEQVIHVIKVDCEGEEFSIFSDLQNFKKKLIHTIVMEYHEHGSYTVDTFLTFFARAGYKVQILPRQYIAHIGLLSAKKRNL
jgi:hypothetical protein